MSFNGASNWPEFVLQEVVRFISRRAEEFLFKWQPTPLDKCPVSVADRGFLWAGWCFASGELRCYNRERSLMIRYDARQNLELDVGHNYENKCQTHVKHDGAEGIHIGFEMHTTPAYASVSNR